MDESHNILILLYKKQDFHPFATLMKVDEMDESPLFLTFVMDESHPKMDESPLL